MGMNIKSEEAHRLARELAKLTGESLNQAVTTAIQERLSRLRPQSSMSDRLRQIREECGPRLQGVEEHSLLLYNEAGLPA